MRAARPPFYRLVSAVLIPLGGFACSSLLSVDVLVVGERTSLERQVLGTYRSLNADFEAFGSVRGVDEEGRVRVPPPITDSKQATLRAMQNRAYNRDDVNEFLRLGLVGEGRDGLLVVIEGANMEMTGLSREFMLRVVAEENADRETVLNRLRETTPGVDAAELDQIRSIFASLNRDAAPAEARVQMEDGSWTGE
jgi:hypothetical protein